MRFLKAPRGASDELLCALTFLNALLLDSSGDAVVLSYGTVDVHRLSVRAADGETITVAYTGRDRSLLTTVTSLLRDEGLAEEFEKPTQRALIFRPVRH